MGKSYKKNRRDDFEAGDDTIFVALSEIYVSDSTWAKLIDRDSGQIELMRQEYENNG